MMSRAVYKKRTGRRFLTGTAVVGLLSSLLLVAGSASALTQSEFELDKNATNDLTTVHLGVIKNGLNATATSVIVCQRTGVTYPPATNPFTPFTIMIDAEQMTVTGYGATTTTTGGCSFSDPAVVKTGTRVYNLTRHVNGTAAASHPGDADVTQLISGAVAGDDWDQVYDSVQADLNATPPITENHTCANIGAVACLFIADGGGDSGLAEETTFTTGGSKDDLNLNPLAGEPGTGWKWSDTSVPPSDEILDAFAAKYDSGGRQLLFFGADRWSTNGAKDMGFWFFHEEIGRNDDGSFEGNHTRPADPDGIPDTGDETRGDILLLSTFTQGGAVTTIRVFEWVGECESTDPACVNGTLLSIGAFGDCVPGNPADAGCNTVANTTIPSEWPYEGSGSSQVPGVIYTGGFSEGGIDLTAIGLEGCFASFLAETRSSPEAGAQLKDFALGGFEVCESDITTTPADGAGTPLTDTDDPVNGIVDIPIGTGTAGVDVTDTAVIDVTGITNWEGTLTFFLCGPIVAPAGLCDSGGVQVSTGDVDQDTVQPITSGTANLTSVGRYCWRGFFDSDTEGVDDATDSTVGECFEVKPVTPTLSTTAWSNGDDTGSAQTVAVDFGDPVFDRADLGGTAYQPGINGGNATYPSINADMTVPADGTITFTLVGPDGETTDCTTVATSDDATEDNPENVTVTGDGDYYTSGFTPDTPGDFHWKASYDGDSPNTLGTSHNDECDEAGEDVSVQQIPTQIKTRQSWIPNDTATITSTVAGDDLDAGGTVVFELWDSATCTGTLLYTETETLTGGSNSEEVGTSNVGGAGGYAISTGYDDTVPSTAGPFSWKVTYTPDADDTAHTGIQSACDAENFSVTYENDSGPGSDLP